MRRASWEAGVIMRIAILRYAWSKLGLAVFAPELAGQSDGLVVSRVGTCECDVATATT